MHTLKFFYSELKEALHGRLIIRGLIKKYHRNVLTECMSRLLGERTLFENFVHKIEHQVRIEYLNWQARVVSFSVTGGRSCVQFPGPDHYSGS